MPKVIGKPIDPNAYPYQRLLENEDRADRLIKIMRKMKIYKRTEAIRFCIDFAFEELVNRNEK